MDSKSRWPLGKKFGFITLLLSLIATGYWLSQHYHEWQAPDLTIGEQIYLRGILGDGSALQGIAQNDLNFSDAQFNCAQCHRASGFGSSEGGNYVLPITGNLLYNPRTFDRADLFNKLFKENQGQLFWARMRSAYQRPAYTDELLARAIRDGVDPSGRQLAPLMPRYQLTDTDMKALIGYLKELSTHNDPGVDDSKLYLATIVDNRVDSREKNAMLTTINTFVEWLNLETAGNIAHPNFSPGYRSEFAKAFRLWQHEVWELPADPNRWQDELTKRYQQQPVFAFIGGMVEGDWTPIHEFCEKNRIPCLFPLTDLPPVSATNHYSLYFNQGLLLEAKAIGRYLRGEKPATPSVVVNLHSEDTRGNQPAQALATLLSGDAQHLVIDMPINSIEQFRSHWATFIQQQQAPFDVVVWPGALTQTLLPEIPQLTERATRVFLPAKILDTELSGISDASISKLYFSYPYELPSAYHPHAFRVRAWMDSHNLPIENERLQFNTYYALNLLQFGLEPVIEHFSRNYLLEYIEHEAENSLNPGTFPRLSLGPGQRYASKGAYVVQIGPNTPDGSRSLSPVSDWIIP